MPRKISVNTEEFLAAVESGMAVKEIMAKFGLKTIAQFKSIYLDSLVATGAAKPVASRGARGAARKGSEIRVNKRGSLVIPSQVVEEMGYKEGDAFYIRRTKSGVSLKKI